MIRRYRCGLCGRFARYLGKGPATYREGSTCIQVGPNTHALSCFRHGFQLYRNLQELINANTT